MKKHVSACLLAVLCLLISACSRPAVEPSSSAAPEPPASAAGPAAPERGSAQEHSAPSSSSAPAPSSSGEESPSGPQTLEPQPYEPPHTPAGSERAGDSLLYGAGIELLDWQWADNDRLLLAVSYPGENPALRILLYSRASGKAEVLHAASSAPRSLTSPYCDDSVDFFVDDKLYSFKKPGGVALKAQDAPEYATDPGQFLPPDDDEYRYFGMRLSSNYKFFFYERAPHDYVYQGKPAGDRLVIDTALSSAMKHPLAELGYPFDVRLSPKSLSWIAGTDRILVDANIPVKDAYGEYRRTFYTVEAPSGKISEPFSPPFENLNDLVLCDAHGTRLLFARAGEPFELLAYDYRTGKSQLVTSKENNNVHGMQAKFSLSGGEVALFLPKTDLVPEFYPADRLD